MSTSNVSILAPVSSKHISVEERSFPTYVKVVLGSLNDFNI